MNVKMGLIILLLTAICGCSTAPKESSATVSGNRVMEIEVIWGNNSYNVGEQVYNFEIGKEIGTADDSHITNCSNCETPAIVKGDKLFEIKGVNKDEAIAVEMKNGKYLKLNKQHKSS